VATRIPVPYGGSWRRGYRQGARPRVLAVAALASVAVIALAACSGSGNSTPPSSSSGSSASAGALPSAPPPSPTSLIETGSTLLYPLFQEWVPAYKGQFSQVTIATAGTGSGKGISSAAGGTADIGASDAYLSPADVSKSPSLENIPLAIAAQEVNYNLPGFRGNISLDGTVLAKMYQGTITTWNDPAIRQLNPGVSLPSTKVIPIHRSDSSGDTFLFTSYLSKQDASWANSISYNTTVAWPAVLGALAFQGNKGIVKGCEGNPGCVAYVGISYLSMTQAAGLGEARLANGAGGYELPAASTISAAVSGFASTTPGVGTLSMINSSAAGAYPIINYEYAIVSTKQSSVSKAQAIKAFLFWAITKGNAPAYLDQVKFQPLPSSVASISEALLSKIS
jgi:phosphate transport system substrate-binding protein